MSSNASTPAPPYTGAPPSNAEMAAEVQQLRNTIRTLQAQMNARPAATNNEGESPNRFQRDIGEALKPPKPEPFTGKAADVIPFLTRMKAHFRLFPNRLDTATKKVLYTSPLIQGDAKEWWEPIMRDFLNNDEQLQEQETQNIFADWDNFEQSLKDNFGVVNEERQAAAEILMLKQHKSCAAYSAKFRQLASKTEWDDDALMEMYYRGLKEEVKDELYIADRPDDLTTYITMAIKIDERQYERRREKANHKRGNDFNPYYPNQRRNDNNQGNSRNQRQRGRYRNDTSYGTHEGPMTLGVTRPDNGNRGTRDMSKRKCYNCNQFGHMARQCPQPRKPRDPNHGRQTLGLTQQNTPQMATRTQTLGMTRSGYDGQFNGEPSITWIEPEDSEEPDHENKVGRKGCPKSDPEEEKRRLRQNENNKRYYERCMEDPEKREKYRKRQRSQRQKQRLEKTRTLGMMRKGKLVARNPDRQNNPQRTIDKIPIRTTMQATERAFEEERTSKNELRTQNYRNSRSMGHRGGAARAAALYLRHEDERLEQKWKEPYEPLYDEQGLRYWNTNKEMCIQTAKEHTNTDNLSSLHIRAYHTNDATNPLLKEPKYDTRDDIRTLPTHPQHQEIAWISCRYHWCKAHKQDKEDNDCFPIEIPNTPNDKPYSREETKGYMVDHWYENLGVAELRFNMTLYRREHRINELTQGIKENMKIIEDAEKEFEEITRGRYEHLRKEPSIDDTSSESTEELQCQWEADGLHLTQEDIPSGQKQPTTDEGLDEELEEQYRQRLFDEEFLNDCPNGEGCNDSDCEQTHRDASGKVTRHL